MMKGLSYLWKMARRRKTSCLLVLLFTMAATVFMLLYPGFIESTRARLAEAYENIEVKGWILNSESYEDPLIPGTTWKELVNSGYFSQTAATIASCLGSTPKTSWRRRRARAPATPSSCGQCSRCWCRMNMAWKASAAGCMPTAALQPATS